MSVHARAFVIVGGGLAGAKAAETLREEGFDGTLVLIGEEAERPYERPPLTKDYLRAESAREKTYVHPEAFYRDHDIELVTGTAVTALDPGGRRLTLAKGGELAYDRLLLATGAEPRRLGVPGAELDGVHYLRTLEDCDALRARLNADSQVAVIGAGWIGAEVAASARRLGARVTMIDPAALPLERVLGPRLGAFYRDVHREQGVELMLGDGVEALEGDGHVRRVRSTSGRKIDCDTVVVGIGVVPRTELAERAGLRTEDGVAVDERLETSAPGVYAAGDVANAWHPFYERRVRVEHWANALNQGPAAALAMLGREVAYDRIPYFFSDQYDVGMEYSGLAAGCDEVVLRGDADRAEFIAFWLRDGRVRAGMNVNFWDVNEHVQALIRSREEIDVSALADPDVPLSSLVAHGEAPIRN
jgi:3-phenylpropionate/trans-cinnamate dioxygenase ferredoxin reductase subunit